MTGDTTQVWLWEFFNPERLWALLVLPVLVIAYILLLRLKRNRGMRYTQTGIVGAVLPRQSQWRRHVSVAMALCSLAAITGAWARPAGTEQVPRERATVVLVLDLSQSMQATDIDPTRLDASKQAAKDFIAAAAGVLQHRARRAVGKQPGAGSAHQRSGHDQPLHRCADA